VDLAPSSVLTAHQVWRGRWAYALLALFALLLFLPGIASLPPTDRDEARFSQASRQMVETGNHIDIRFQNEARNKKPVGIYWLQAASAKVFGKDKIWPYRLPSLLGALGAVLALAALARPAFGREAGLIAGFLMAGSLLLTVESHLAKTDAVLLLTVVVAQLALAQVYLRSRTGAPIALSIVLLFWFAQGAGILIKGPVTPLISILTIVTLWIADRIAGIRSGFAARLRPAIGIPLALLIAAPWFIAVSLGDSAFLKEAVGQDLLPKLIGGQEAHGAPPGYYLLTITLTFWPAALIAWPAVIWAWRNRREPALRFLLAWLIPGWILFELIPTKLPHYVLPLLPAVALMAALASRDAPAALAATLRSWGGRALIVLWSLVGLALGALLLAGTWQLEHRFAPLALVPLGGALVAVAVGGTAAWRGDMNRAAVVSLLAVLLMWPPIFGRLLPALESVWLSRSVAAEVAKQDTGAPRPPVAAVGYHEPSLVFLLGTNTLLTNAAGAAQHLAKNPQAVAVVAERDEADFRDAALDLGFRPLRVGIVEGFNTARGRRESLRIYWAR
jgi:4-amino-4-deoxy-L-arabinose transferase-like glycosyltransferase